MTTTGPTEYTSEAQTGRPAGRPHAFILTGHVDRLALFAPLLTEATESGHARERGLPSCTGQYGAVDVTVVGTGMGGPATVRAVELARFCRATVVVRAGGAGPIADHVATGDHIIATAAVRDEGASQAFLPLSWPAVAHPDVVDALERAAHAQGLDCQLGVVHSKDAFFAEVDPDSSPVAQRLHSRWAAWRQLGVLASEMEAAALFCAATHHGLKAGAVLRINDVVSETGGLRPVESRLCAVTVAGAAAAANGERR